MRCGDTVLIPAPGGRTIPHLWIVLTEPDPATHQCVIVNVTTLRYAADQTVILQPGDHPFISHPSVISFADAMIVDVRRIEDGIRNRTAKQHARCSNVLLKEIQRGMLGSPFAKRSVIDFCKRVWGR